MVLLGSIVCLSIRSERITGRVSEDITSSGQPPLFDQEEESLLVEHIKTMANLDYGYTCNEVVELASKFAVDIGKRVVISLPCHGIITL